MTIGQNIIRLDSVDSTNNFTAMLVKDRLIDHGTVILAEEQTKGRGQSGNRWHSEKGKNLTFTLFIKPRGLPLANQFQLAVFVSVSILEMLSALGIEAKIKWPNDILVNEKKIAGILIENTIEEGLIRGSILGIGLNVNQYYFDVQNSVSMVHILGEEKDKTIVLNALINRLHINWEKFNSVEGNALLMNCYLNHLFGKDEQREFIINGEQKTGIIRGVDDFGHLSLEISGIRQFYDLKQLQFIFQNVSSD
jgi:BirA family biotin operon repressor/biotin-[acetyl-CoA-carboxylase] ligase